MDVTGIPEGFELVEEPQDEVIDITVEEDKQPPTNVPEGFELVEDSSEEVVEEVNTIPTDSFLDSPYFKDRKLGEFVVGRDGEKIVKEQKKEEDKTVNENYLKALNYVEVPGQDFEFRQSRASKPGVEESYLDGEYNNLIEQSSFPDGQINPSFQSNLDQWFQTDEGSAWWEENWYNPVNPYVVSKQGLKEDIGYQTGSSVLSKVNLLAGKVLMQDESASLEDQVAKSILQDTENSFNPLIQKGISYGGSVNNSIALNNKIGEILSNKNIDALDIVNPNNPSELSKNYELPAGVLDKAKKELALENAEAASKYQDPIVAQSGYHQREIIKLSTNNAILNPLNLGDSKTLLDNQKQIKFHEDEINKLKKDYFKDEENGIPSQWYDPLSGSMVKRSKATDSQTEEVAERIAAASEKWGDTNIETLYEKENEIANEVIYLAKTAFDNFENIENDVSVFNVGRQITMMDNRYQKMLSNQYGLNTLSEGLMYLPGSNVIAKNFNAKLDELLQIQKAIDLNFKPTDLDVPDYRFFDYLSSASSKKLGNLGEDNEAVRKTNEALNFIDFTEQTVGSKKTEELKKMWEPGMSESSANAIVDGIQIAGEFILARKIAGKTPAMVKDGVKGIANFLGAEGRVAKGTANILGAIGEEAYVIELRNQAVRPLGEEPMSKLFALGAGTAGTMVKQAQNTLLKSQSYRNLITTINKSKVAQNVINGTVQPVVGTFNIIAGQVGERSILEDITLKEAFEEATEFENFVNTLIMVKSAGAVNPVRGITKLYDAGVNDFYSYKGRINKEANKAAKILGFEGSFTGENVLQNKEINSKATSLRNKEGLNKPDSELTEEQVKRKNDIRNSVKSLKDQILYKETSDFIKSTYGKNEYANLYTTGRMLANGQEPTPQMKLSIANMSSLNQAYSVIADPNGPFVKNKRLETDVMNYVSRYKNFIDGVRRTGKTANDPRKEAKLIEKFDAYQSEIAGPLAILEAAKKTAKGEDLKSIKEKISDLEIKQQEYVDGINLDLQEYTTKRRKQIRGKVADIINKQDVVKYEVLSNEEFLKRFKEKGTEGLFVNDRGEMFVNEDYAKEINNVSVDSHELLHPAMNVTLNKLAKNGKLKPFIDEFKSSLPANVLAEAKRIIDERADITDKDYTREWFNVVSDVLQSGRIKVTNTRSNMQRLADTFTEFFKTETPMKDVDFETGNEAYEFIKRYSKTFREGKTDAPLEEAVVSKLKRFEKSEGTERSAEEKMSEDKINKFTKTKEGKPMTRVEWFEFTGKMNDKGELINQNKIGNAFEGLINSKIKGDKNKPGWIFGDNTKKDIIDDFKFRLRKRGFYDKKIEEFNPEVNDNFSGYMAGIINNVYKDILAANTKKVKTTSLDKQQEIMQREGKEMASSDMSAEDLTDISLEKDRQAKAKEQEPKETTASKIGMPKEVKTPSGKVESNEYIEKVVNEINFKDLKDITTEPGPNQTISPFLSNLKAKVATDGNVKKDISQGMGRAKERASYLETNFEKLAKSLDPTYFSGLIEREISKGKKVTLPKGLIQKDIGSGYTSDWYGKKAVGTKAAKTGITSGLKRIRLNPDFNFKNKANAKIFADAFKSQGRYEGLAGQIGAKAVIDVVEKSLGTGNKVDTKIKDIYEIQGRDLPADYAKNFREQILKASIERSRTPEEELSLKSTIEEIKKANKKTLKTGDTSVIGKMRDRVRKYGATPITTGKVSSDRIIEFFTGDGLDVFANLLYQAKGKRGKFQFLGSNVMSNAGNLLPSAIKNLFPAVGSYEAAVKAKMKSDGFSRKQAEEFYKDLKVAIEAGEILETSKLQQLVKETLGDKVVFSEEQLEQLNYALDNQTASKLQSNIKNIKNIIKGKNQLLDLMKEAFDKNNKNIDVLSFISYHAKSNTNPFRNFATVLGKESGKIFNNKGREDVGYEEHTLPFGEFANMMIEGLSLDAKAFEGMKKWINENYFQEAIDYETTRAILDQKTRSLGKDGKELPKWFSKQEMHPLLAKHISEALKGQRAWSEVVSADIRKYNEYATDPDLGYVNPNKLNRVDLKTGKVISDAKRYNVEVDRFLQNNPRIIEAQNDLIYKQLIGEITPAQAKQRLKYIIDALGTKKADLAFKGTKKEIDQSGVLVTNEKMTTGQLVTKANKIDKALDIARSSTAPIKKIRVFDFDDTLAKTESLVFYDRPNEGGKPAPKNKAIFMIGGPGSGKTNIGKGLQLGREGWKVVNQDIFIESEKAKAGLPESETGYTKEQKSLRGKIGAAGVKAAKAKLDKYTEAGEGMVIDGTGASYNATMKKVKALEEQGYEVFMVHAKTSAKTAVERNKARKERSLPTFVVERTQKSVAENIDKYKKDFGDKFMEIDTETIEYGKPLPDSFIGQVKSKVYANERGRLTAEDFAKKGQELVEQGFAMDFSDFNVVRKGERGPLFEVAETIKKARGNEDLYVLTARAPESQKAIYEFLKGEGLEFKEQNIIGLGNSTGKAKANWLVNKAAEGYNDFYFADDAYQNVKAVRDALEVLDVKSKTQIAKIQRSSNMSEDFNKIIEESTGIGAEKVFSDVKAQVRGGKKKGQRFFIPPSAEDFLGLVYTTLGKGKKGEAGLKFYQENLFDPYTRAMENLSTDRVNLMADFKELKKELDVPKDLQKTTESGFTNEQAVRVHLWSKMGETIPGLSKTDLKELNDIVEKDAKLKVFADQILSITKGDGYSTPKESWAVGTITTDLIDVLNTKKRSKYLQTWTQNKNIIYSKENLNKLEAAYGRKYREAIENSLSRMESGSNRVQGGNRLSNQVLDYINNSTGAIMFFNTRSAVLQTLSAANFINWSFNNPFKAGKAFANQPQYWKDFTKLMNSDYLKDRRNGLKLNINESEIANAAKTSKNKAKAALNYILEKGYLPTKYADSFAIASGGATFYRNRINDLIKNEGKTEAEAEAIAMKEFRQISEMSQQSSDPSKISSQQASDLGRVVLQFANTPMQYARIQKRAVQDLVNRRGDWKTNVSKIAYYGFLQNMMFNALQQGLFALGFGDDEIDEKDEKKIIKAANGMLDSSLRGLGLAGVTVGVLKNLGIDIYERSKRKTPDFVDSYKKLLEFSPAIKSKLGKFQSAAYPFDSKKRRAEVFEKGFSLDNPAYESMAKVITGTTNLPLDRLYSKVENLKGAMDEETETWQSIAMVLGWPEWQIKSDKKNTVPLRPQTEKQLKRKSKFKTFKVGNKSKTKTSRKSRFK